MPTALGDIQEKVGMLLEGQRHADESRRIMHEKQDKTDELLDALTARLQDVAVTARMTNETAVKLANHIETLEARLTTLEPMVRANTEFKILAAPLVKIVRQIRLYVVGLIAFFTTLIGGCVAVWAFAGPFMKAVFKTWLAANGPTS